jgi:hypothetical protein
VLISADMEGATGTVLPADVSAGNPRYERFRRLLTGDVNAAVAGFVDGSAGWRAVPGPGDRTVGVPGPLDGTRARGGAQVPARGAPTADADLASIRLVVAPLSRSSEGENATVGGHPIRAGAQS